MDPMVSQMASFMRYYQSIAYQGCLFFQIFDIEVPSTYSSLVFTLTCKVTFYKNFAIRVLNNNSNWCVCHLWYSFLVSRGHSFQSNLCSILVLLYNDSINRSRTGWLLQARQRDKHGKPEELLRESKEVVNQQIIFLHKSLEALHSWKMSVSTIFQQLAFLFDLSPDTVLPIL